MRAWPTWMLSPGLTLRRVMTPSISAMNVAIAEIELGLVEIAPGHLKLGLGLLDVRRVGREPSESGVYVALLFERLDHVTGSLVERMDDAELSRALNQRRLRLKHGREGLIEVGRNLAEILPVAVPAAIREKHGFDGHRQATRQRPRGPPTRWPAGGRTPTVGYRSTPPVSRPGRSRPGPARVRPCSCRRQQPWRAAPRPGRRRPPSHAAAPGAGSWPPLRCRALWPSPPRAQPSPYPQRPS